MLPRLEAERQLLAIEAASVAHMDRQAIRDVFRRLQRAQGSEQAPAKPRLSDLAAIGITVTEVDAQGMPLAPRDTTGHDDPVGEVET